MSVERCVPLSKSERLVSPKIRPFHFNCRHDIPSVKRHEGRLCCCPQSGFRLIIIVSCYACKGTRFTCVCGALRAPTESESLVSKKYDPFPSVGQDILNGKKTCTHKLMLPPARIRLITTISCYNCEGVHFVYVCEALEAPPDLIAHLGDFCCLRLA